MFQDIQQQFAESGAGRWYYGREARERSIIAALAIALMALLLWSVVWKPVSDWREVEDNRYRNAQSLMQWMQANEQRARAVAQGQGQGGGAKRSLLPTVTSTAAGQGITLTRLQPEANGAVSIVIQGQPFNAVLRWLHQLQRSNGVSIQRISLDAEGQPGYVNAQVRLQ